MGAGLPGKLRSSALLIGILIVEDRSLFAEYRLTLTETFDQFSEHTQQSQHQRCDQHQEQQANDEDVHISSAILH